MAVLAVTAVLGAGFQAIAQRRDAAAHPPPGELIELTDGRTLHLDVQGRQHDGPVVVLETGMGGSSAAWGWVQPAVAEHATVVAYDRAGLGWSDRSAHDPSAAHVVADLRDALTSAGLAGRGYLLVGHSLGAHYVRHFAHAHPDEVVGMVLVDPSHEQQAELLPQTAYGFGQAALLRSMQVAAAIGATRLYDPFAPLLADLPEPQRAAARAQQVTPGYFATYRREAAAMDRIGRGLAELGSDLADLPLTVLMAGHSPRRDGQQLVDDMNELRRGLVGLSTRGVSRLLEDADHLSIVTAQQHATHVVDAILDTARLVDDPSDRPEPADRTE